MRLRLIAAVAALALIGHAAQAAAEPKPTAAAAKAFTDAAEAQLAAASLYAAKAAWVQATYITVDTDWLSSRGGRRDDRVAHRSGRPGGAVRRRAGGPGHPPQINLAQAGHHPAGPAAARRGPARWPPCPPPCNRPTPPAFSRTRASPITLGRTPRAILAKSARSCRVAGGLGGVAHRVAADGPALRQAHWPDERGRPGPQLQGRRRPVAVGLRHGAGRLRRPDRSPVGAAGAALQEPALLRPRPAERRLRRTPCSRAPARSAPIFWAICGASSGATSTIWCGPRTPRSSYGPGRPAGGGRIRSGEDGAHRRGLLFVPGLRAPARRLSGSGRCWSGPRTARWSATPRPGTWTIATTCASRCASRSTRRTSTPSTTNWGTTTISGPMPISPTSSADGAQRRLS